MDPIGKQIRKRSKISWIIIGLIILVYILPIHLKLKLLIFIIVFSVSGFYDIFYSFKYKYLFVDLAGDGYPSDSFRKRYYKSISIFSLFVILVVDALVLLIVLSVR